MYDMRGHSDGSFVLLDQLIISLWIMFDLIMFFRDIIDLLKLMLFILSL